MRDAVEPTHDAHGIFLYLMGRFIEEKGVSKNFSGSCLLLELSRLHAVDGWRVFTDKTTADSKQNKTTHS